MLQADVMQFAVIAKNEGVTGTLTGDVNVTVRVLDVNDNEPIIAVPSSTTAANSSDDDISVVVDVCGQARRGDRLVRVEANDVDSGLNARLHYTLLDDDHEDATSSSSSSSYFSVNGDDGWIAAKHDLDQLDVGQTLPVTVVVADGGRPPLSANKTFLLTISIEACVAPAAAAGSTEYGQVRAAGRFTAAVISTIAILFLIAVLVVVLLLTKCRRRREKLDAGVGSSVVLERRWTEADGAEELTAKQRLNSGLGDEKASTLCFRRPPDDVSRGARSCFNIQHEFEVVWQASSPCLQQVFILTL